MHPIARISLMNALARAAVKPHNHTPLGYEYHYTDLPIMTLPLVIGKRAIHPGHVRHTRSRTEPEEKQKEKRLRILLKLLFSKEWKIIRLYFKHSNLSADISP